LLQKRLFCFSFVSFTNLLGLCLYGRGKKKKALWAWLRSLSLDREHPLTLKYLQEGFGEEKSQKKLRKTFLIF
jgi:hypothetical protein